ncbi:NAD-dependent protein deacetylase sirtuin-1-like [Bradysia coprophila]|uniref:NAD-dependent protein deacetylase sirtuin-1-like n=1 Tax=Bradysia coprophila TaxID=38358 RepID=UPI00187D9D9C|nr:NAD-dependent protein deacetylase sirtuin-1-like [Bradysia coprophila]
MNDYPKVSNDISSSSVDSANTTSSKNSATTNETINSIKYQESSGLSTPPTADAADTCDSGFTEFFSTKAGTSTQPTPRISQKHSQSSQIRDKSESASDSDSNSKWKTDDVMRAFDDDSFDESDCEENDFQSKEKMDLSRINYRWIEWCHKQLVSGVNPRAILRKIFRNGEFPVPQGVSDRELWARISTFVTQPAVRTRLPDINSIDHVIHLLSTCKNIIVLTGAGVSVSCGIPDFRSRSGIYSRLRSEMPEIDDPHEIFDIRFFSKDPRPFFKFAKELYPGSFTPSLCHRFIRLLERKERLLRNYSQNIDTLERLAGIERVVECHGSFATARCTKCSVVVTAEEIREDVLAKRIPMCSICNPVTSNESSTGNQSSRISHCTSMTEGYKDLYEMGILKPDIVFFGESLPEMFHPAINADRQQCDCLLVIGSSLKVRPVSLIPEFLNETVPQILINRERVGNYVFDVELLGDADVIVNQICRMIGGDWTEICEQPELKLSSALEFNPETTETVDLPLTRPTPIMMSSPESDTTRQDGEYSPLQGKSTATETTENTDAIASPTESDAEKLNIDQSKEVTPARQPSNGESTHSRSEPPAGDAVENTDNGKFKTVFVFSAENIPSGCYYSTHPNKYVFPGSTHTWYGSGNPDEDREGIFEEEEEDDEEFEIGFDDDDDDEDDDEDVEDCDEDKCETESSTNQGENSDSNDVVDENSTPSDSVLLGKRIGGPEIAETVSPVKQPKPNDD